MTKLQWSYIGSGRNGSVGLNRRRCPRSRACPLRPMAWARPGPRGPPPGLSRGALAQRCARGQSRRARRDLLARAPETVPILVRVVRQSKTRWHTDILPWLDSIPSLGDRRTRQLRLERNALEVLQRTGV